MSISLSGISLKSIFLGIASLPGPLYQIPRSLRFRSSASAALSRLPTSSGSGTTYTVSFWIKRGSINDTEVIFSVGDNTPGIQQMYFDTSNRLNVNSNVALSLVSNEKFTDPSAWYHIVLAMDTTQSLPVNRTKLYVNGISLTYSLANYPNQSQIFPTSLIGSTGKFSLGAQYASQYFIDGYIAEFYFIDGLALSPASFGEINALWGTWVAKPYTFSSLTYDSRGNVLMDLNFDSGFIDQTTTYGNTIASTSSGSGSSISNSIYKFGGGSAYFDGTLSSWVNDAGPSTTNLGTNDFTLQCWVYQTVYTGSGAIRRYISMETGTNAIVIREEGGHIKAFFRMGSSTVYQLDSGTAPSVNTWMHLAVVRSSNTFTLYIDGISTATMSNSGPIDLTGIVATIGSDHAGGTETLTGYVDEVIFLNNTALWTSNFTPPNAEYVYTPTYATTNNFGTNGCYLPFSNTSSTTTLGNDLSSLGNNWTTSNVSLTAGSTYDSMLDVPLGSGGSNLGNYAIITPLEVTAGYVHTESNGNLTSTSAGNLLSSPSIDVSSGKWYFEVTPTAITGTLFLLWNGPAGGQCGYMSTGEKFINGSITSYGSSFTTGDVIGIAADYTNNLITFYKNGVSQGNISYTPMFGPYFTSFTPGVSISANFGQQPFSYSVPAGFSTISTNNLPLVAESTSGSFTGNASIDGPFVYSNGIPATLTINGNAVTWGTDAIKLSNGFKIITANTNYNASGANSWVATYGINSNFYHQLAAIGTNGIASDPYFANVSLLLHADGTNGSTSVLDSSLRTKTVTAQNGGTITTTYKEFGTGSLVASDGYYTSPSDADFALPGDYTLEMWIYPTGGSVSALQSLFNIGRFDTGMLFRYDGNPTTAAFQSYVLGNANGWNITPLTDNVWHFIVIQISAGNQYLYIDGIKQATVWPTLGSIPAHDITIGTSAHLLSETFLGYIDEIRLTKGVARYTGDFTPPTAPFPNS